MRFTHFFKNIFYIFFLAIKTFLFITVLAVLYYSVVPVPATPLMYIRMFEGATEGKFTGIDYDWEPYSDISPNIFRAVIGAEDGRFLTHDGIDWRAVRDAERYNARHKGKKLRGASTISMQTARNAFLWQERSYFRKAMEVMYTGMIEEYWSKKRILEVYVNIIEWGDGVYGVEAASQKYFNKPASELSRRQAALLAAALPGPRKWNPARPTNYLNRRASWIQGRMGVALPKDEDQSKK